MERRVNSSLSGWPFHFKSNTGALIQEEEKKMGRTLQSTAVIAVHLVALPLHLVTGSGRWMAIVSRVRNLMWADWDRICPLNSLGRSCRDQPCVTSCDVHLLYFFHPITTCGPFYSLLTSELDLSPTELGDEHMGTNRHFLSFSPCLFFEGQDDVPILVVVFGFLSAPVAFTSITPYLLSWCIVCTSLLEPSCFP